jgi:single-stranded-DNA-specific exonuclease
MTHIQQRPLPVAWRAGESASEGRFSQLHPVLQRVYAARQVTQESQLDLSLGKLESYAGMKGIEQAVELLLPVVLQGKSLLVVGDFDVDGATSTALALLALKEFVASTGSQTGRLQYLVPNRFEFGYGLTPELVEVATQFRPDLIMTVDNGIASVAGVEAAQSWGIPVLVTDHHLPGEELPAAAAIVNPNQPGCAFSSKAACGCTVVFYLMLALRKRLESGGHFVQPAPNMGNFLDLVALATVADVVPLDFNNRILVDQGLKRIRSGRVRPGIQALIEIAGRSSERLVASDFGFALGPRLNAAGRLDDMALGIECLMASDKRLAIGMAQQLDALNRERRDIETSMTQDATRYLDSWRLEDPPPAGLVLFQADWHPGVVGILASRVKDKAHRPVVAFAEDGDQLKGSARSIKGLHMRDALDLVTKALPDVVVKFGGHAMAAGISIRPDNRGLERFEQQFQNVCDRLLSEEDRTARLMTDGELKPQEFGLELAQDLRWAGPWGQQFPEPLFSGEFQLIQQRLLGGKHLKLVVQPLGSDLLLDGIWFNVDADQWPKPDVRRANIAFQLDVNEYKGRESVQLLIKLIQE